MRALMPAVALVPPPVCSCRGVRPRLGAHAAGWPPASAPAGIIVAAPIYAATGSRPKALALAAASGLSEPLGALVALLLVKPFVTHVSQLDYLLAFVGGVMLAVCAMELWPEARRCRQDARMAQGVAAGAAVMLVTLYHGV